MVVMRWLIALGLIAGCGRLGFDPLDEGRPGDNGAAGEDGSDGVGPDGGGNGGGDGAGTMPTAHYITGGSASFVSATTVSTTTGPLTDQNMVLVVAIHWRNGTSRVTTVQDSFGNGFSMIGSKQAYNATSQVMWFKRVTAGTTIQIFFDQAAPTVDVKWAAYRDIDQTNPIVSPGFIGGSGTSTNPATAMLTVDAPAVMVASSGSLAGDAAPGPGFTERHKSGGGVLEDLEAPAGMFNATATLNTSNIWIIQLAALRPL